MLGSGAETPGAPQQTMPQSVGIPGEKVKFGVIPPMGFFVAMIQRTLAPLFGGFGPGTKRRTVWLVPLQLKAVSRVFVTRFWVEASILISTYCAVASLPTRDITSSISEA